MYKQCLIVFMLYRQAEEEIRVLSSEFPIIAIPGPGQSGKTTLSKIIFPDTALIIFFEKIHSLLSNISVVIYKSGI